MEEHSESQPERRQHERERGQKLTAEAAAELAHAERDEHDREHAREDAGQPQRDEGRSEDLEDDPSDERRRGREVDVSRGKMPARLQEVQLVAIPPVAAEEGKRECELHQRGDAAGEQRPAERLRAIVDRHPRQPYRPVLAPARGQPTPDTLRRMSESERRPAIVAVDDEPAVLAAVARDLRRGFGERYRILRAASGPEALDMLRELRTRGDRVALLIADQRMPGMAGTEYLVQARELVPDAKRVLLTAYADTEAAIAAINDVALDYYLLKPWDPPEEQLYPVLEDLLTTWESGASLESGGLRIIGHRFSKESHELRDFVARNRVPARWLDVELDGEARELLKVVGVGADCLPVALLEDGSVLERPTILELAGRLGIASQPTQEHYDLVIVGAGPPGSPPRSTVRPRGSGRSCSSARRPAARPASRAASRTTSAFRWASAARISRAARPIRRAGSVPSC